MQLASCLTQWWTSQGETARGVSDIIIQSSGSYLNYNQEVFIGFAVGRCNSFPALGVKGIRSLASQDVGCVQFLQVGGAVGVLFNMWVAWDKISSHPNVCDLERKFRSSLDISRDVAAPCFKYFHWLALPICVLMSAVVFGIRSPLYVIVCNWVQTKWCCLARWGNLIKETRQLRCKGFFFFFLRRGGRVYNFIAYWYQQWHIQENLNLHAINLLSPRRRILKELSNLSASIG